MKKKILSLLLAAALAAGAMAGCSQGGDSSSPSNTSTNAGSGAEALPINVCIGPEPETIDPALNNSVDGYSYAVHAFEGIYKLDKDSKPVLAQAKDVKKSEDELTWTITLRDDIKWSDGQPVTAEDFVYSWRRAADPATASDYANLYEVLENGADVTRGNKPVEELGCKVIDEKTIELKLAAISPYMEKLLAFPTWYPVRKDVVEGNDAWTQSPDTYIGNGPMKLTGWSHKEALTYVKNEHYYDAANVTNSTLKFALIEDDNAKLSAYKNGELDYIFQLPIGEIDALRDREDFLSLENAGTYYIDFNNKKAPFDNPKVRQALTLAIDRDYIVNTVSKQSEVPAGALVAPFISDAINGKTFRDVGGDYFDPSKEAYEENVKKAKQLMSEAGYPDGNGFPTFEYITNDTTLHLGIAEALQNMWKEALGIDMKIQKQEWSVFQSTRQNGEFEVCRDGWVTDYDDPSSFLEIFVSDNGNNNAQYDNKDYDALIQKIKTTADPVERFKLLHEAEDMLLKQDFVFAPVFYYRDTALKNPKLEGYWSSPLGSKNFMYSTKTA